MLSLKESLKILKETDALAEGHFILSSGLHSSKFKIYPVRKINEQARKSTQIMLVSSGKNKK